MRCICCPHCDYAEKDNEQTSDTKKLADHAMILLAARARSVCAGMPANFSSVSLFITCLRFCKRSRRSRALSDSRWLFYVFELPSRWPCLCRRSRSKRDAITPRRQHFALKIVVGSRRNIVLASQRGLRLAMGRGRRRAVSQHRADGLASALRALGWIFTAAGETV